MKYALDISRLKACREKMKITKQEAAKLLGVSQPAYLRYENGTRTPTIPVINEIAKLFGVSLDYLLGNTDQMQSGSITIDKEAQPELYSLIERCRNLDEKQIKRLSEYIEKLGTA